jgi:hypothetical protein
MAAGGHTAHHRAVAVAEQRHGADPVSPAFGAHRLAAGGATGHTGYFEPGTGSLANMAAVGTGAYHRVDEL